MPGGRCGGNSCPPTNDAPPASSLTQTYNALLTARTQQDNQFLYSKPSASSVQQQHQQAIVVVSKAIAPPNHQKKSDIDIILGTD